MNKKPPLLLMVVINRFQKNCGTFRGGGKNPLLSMTLGQFTQTKRKKKNQTKPNKTLFYFFIKNNNDNGLDVNIVMVI